MTTPTTDSAAHAHLRRTEVTVTIAIFVTLFATGLRLARLPLRSLIKDDFGLPPEAMAEFFALVGLAWYLKPFAGILSDQIPLGGTRRKHYLVLSAIGGAATWTIAAVMPLRIETLLMTIGVVNVMAVLGNSVAGGLLVDAGRKHGATGRLSSLRVVAMNAASLIAGPLGGWLAAKVFPLTCLVCATLMLLMAVVITAIFRPDAPSPKAPARVVIRLRDAVMQCKDRRIWSVALFTGALYLTPGFQSLFYYYQRDQLEFTDQTIGLFAGLNCLGGMLGAFCYFHTSARFMLRTLIIGGTLLCATCSFAYLWYDSLAAAFVFEPIAGFCFVLGIIPIHEITARASPPAHEAFGFAVILSVGNAAIAMSDVIGTHLAAKFGFDLDHMIVINSLSIVATLVLLPLVPNSLLGPERPAID